MVLSTFVLSTYEYRSRAGIECFAIGELMKRLLNCTAGAGLPGS